jgi:signal transduction histidine kinase
MPAGIVERIFDPFFTTKGENGTGLGLSQVSACMRLHRGHINVTSRIGSGTAVDLLFPLEEEAMIRAMGATVARKRKF